MANAAQSRSFWSTDPPTLPLKIRQTAVYKCLDDAEGRSIAFLSLQETPERDLGWAEWLRDRANAHDALVEALRGVAIMLNSELAKYENEPWAQRVRAALAEKES